MAKTPNRKQQRQPLKVDPSWAVDPESDLVSASELRAWRNDITTQKVLRYLARYRGQVLEYMGEGGTIAQTSDATAVQTTEASAKAQILKDLIELAPADIASFYGLGEPAEAEAKK